MSRQSANIDHDQNRSMHESNLWLLGAALFLAMLLANFSAKLNVPFWVFYTVAFALAIALATLSPSWEIWHRPSDQPSRNLGHTILYLAFFLVVVEVAWFGFVQRNWQLLAVWLPVTLLGGIFLNLAIKVGVERGIPLRFLVIPIISLLTGGLIALLVPDFDFINSFPLSFVVLSLATGLWLRFRKEHGANAD